MVKWFKSFTKSANNRERRQGQMSAQTIQPAVGPFLRFQDYIQNGPHSATWNGSVLFVCHNSVSSWQMPVLEFMDGEQRHRVNGQLLESFLEWQFWRFNLTFALGQSARSIIYWIDVNPASGVQVNSWTFTIPGASQRWRWAAYSCSGYSSSVDRMEWGGADHPMFQDLLREHAKNPFHALVGGGDQLYNDGVFHESCELMHWMSIKNRRERLAQPFNPQMCAQSEWFYFKNYCICFMESGFREALATISNVMLWDDHDIFDGWGSYPDDLLNSPVFQGVYQVACRFYLLFQQHATYSMVRGGHTELFGCVRQDTDHISFNFVKQFGPNVALAGVDIRAERTKNQILSQATWDTVFDRIRRLPNSVRHLIVELTVPILYPKVPLTEGALEMLSYLNRIDAINQIMVKTGLFSKIMDFDEPELLDDLVDHWTAGPHKKERAYVVEQLQTIARTKGLRITFLSGDVHCAAVGQFYSHPKMRDLACDPHYMPQVISSAIVNAPPPGTIIKMMHTFNWASNTVNPHTREKMVRCFKGKYPQQDKVLGRRNYLIVTEMDDDRDGSLECELRIEYPHALGQCETFPFNIPILIGYGHHSQAPSVPHSFPGMAPPVQQNIPPMAPTAGPMGPNTPPMGPQYHPFGATQGVSVNPYQQPLASAQSQLPPWGDLASAQCAPSSPYASSSEGGPVYFHPSTGPALPGQQGGAGGWPPVQPVPGQDPGAHNGQGLYPSIQHAGPQYPPGPQQ